MFRKLFNDELGRMTVEEFKQADKLPVVLVLDNIRSQHNIGSAFRTADSFRLEGICLCGICAVPPTAEIHKSALGAEFSMDWEYYDSTLDAVSALSRRGYRIVSVEQTENSTTLDRFEWDGKEPLALVFGNEVRGVDQQVVDMSSQCIEIPQFGTKHSLNVSVSIGIVTWQIIEKQILMSVERMRSNAVSSCLCGDPLI